ncbi:DMT family transporter [Sphingomonas baiyangensis]|uniref:DMT family transporter n=1 Tax=Sphingomonas baiyangensis TaxID=2572576 RepID=A0A4U1L3S9_9SPHN|nr:DMT family transporter [Sphingomonas baiyangensis]TKD50853.1 DMT family transporter [Sphingomonas baiyangensis]
MSHRSASPLIAFAVALVGIAVFSAMDALMKALVIAIGVYNTLFWRNLAGVAIGAAAWVTGTMCWPGRAALRLHLVRGCVGAVMALLFFWGLARVPMAQAIALAFIAPILSLFLAAWLLGERVARRTIHASLLALAGVGVILAGQWQAELGPDAFRGALAILASALCYAWNIVLMRQQSLLADAREVAFFQSLVVAALFACAAPWLALWPQGQWPALIAAAILGVASLFLLAWAYARGEASYLAPTEYSSFVWAALLGWLVFGERVSGWTLAGAALIVVASAWAARPKPAAAAPLA